MDDHFQVVKSLETLSKRDLRQLGGALGLSYPKLRKMDSLLEEMVCAWLNKEDNVLKQSGEPSWRSLKSALREIGQEGVAASIAQGIQYKYETRAPSCPLALTCPLAPLPPVSLTTLPSCPSEAGGNMYIHWVIY